jgi:hypothetical protein
VTNDIYPSRKFQVPIQPRARVETVRKRPRATKPLLDERRPVYTLDRRQRPRDPRPFRDVRTDKIVWRLRGGKGFVPDYSRWHRPCPPSEPRLAQFVPTEDGGRELQWLPYPRGWAASDPGDGPWVLKKYAELALLGADLSGCDKPAIRAFVARTVRAHLRARGGESEEQELCRGCVPLGPPWIAEAARQIYALELEHAKRHDPQNKSAGRRINTSEDRNDHGEIGPEVRIGDNGRVVVVKGSAYLSDRSPVKVTLNDYSTRRDVKFKGGKRKVDTQMADDHERPAGGPAVTGASSAVSDCKLKPGPQPKFGVAMDAAARKAKQRCEERGLPFDLSKYLESRRARDKHDHQG